MKEKPATDMGQMPGMNMNSNAPMNMPPETFVEKVLAHDTSGTSAQPNSTPTPMLMKTVRLHGREPDEFRGDLDQGKIDSWSTRLTIQPRFASTSQCQ